MNAWRETVLIAISWVLLFSCPSAALAEGRACSAPDKTFQSFLGKFTENKKFQKQRIILPIVYRYGILELGDPEIELWHAKKVESLENPLIMSTAQRKEFGIEQELRLVTKDYAEVFHYKPEADTYEILFSFRRVKGCWFLEGLHETSL